MKGCTPKRVPYLGQPKNQNQICGTQLYMVVPFIYLFIHNHNINNDSKTITHD